MKKQQAGMTLIELVIVIIVLGIIAAVAAPKLADVSTSAKASSSLGSIGAFKSAVTITQALKTTAIPAWDDFKVNLEGFDVTTDSVATVDFDGDSNKDLEITGSSLDCSGAVTALAGADLTTAGKWLSYTAVTYEADGTTAINTTCFNM